MNDTPQAANATEIQNVEGAPEVSASAPNPIMQFLPFILIFAILYFMMIRPQQRKEKERRKMIESLRAGARVVCANGIIGDIVEASEKTFIVESAGSKFEVLRSSVLEVVPQAAN